MIEFGRGVEVVDLRAGYQATSGSGQPASLQLDEPTLSREHAELIWNDGRLEVRDLGSTNGIRLNGEKTRGCTLEECSVVSMGRAKLSPHRAAPRGGHGVLPAS